MATGSCGWAAETRAVLNKDLAVELRTRYALTAIALFAVTCLTAVSFTVGPQAQTRLQAALLWLVLLFAALTGLSRTFVAEEDGRTADALRLAASPASVFLGKLLFNLLLLLALAVVLVPAYAVLMQVGAQDLVLLSVALLTGCWGLATVLTFTAALVAQARARGALGAVLAFPLLTPLLWLAIEATANGLGGQAQGWGQVRGLVAYGGIMTTVGVLLFESVWSA